MSTVKANAFLDASGGNTATINSMTPTGDSLQGFRNRIINGDMRIDQRNAGASVSLTNAESFCVDRFAIRTRNGTGNTAIRSTTAPTGFTNSLLITVGTGASPGTTDSNYFYQRMEGFNVADLMFGTANAKTITLSFWVRSSLTGQFGVVFRNAANNRSYPATYTINASNTFEYKTITIAGDTTGTWPTDNTGSLTIMFNLGSGTDLLGTPGAWAAADYRGATGDTRLVATTGATLYITGVQLEVGSVATPFERRPYGTELALCQRYYYRTPTAYANGRFGTGYATSTTAARVVVWFPVTMRTNVSALEQSGTATDYALNSSAGSPVCTSVPTYVLGTTINCEVAFTVAAVLTAGNGLSASISGASNGYLGFSAEL